MSLRIATDSALEPGDQMELPEQKPFGHYIAHTPGKEFVIVSELSGELGSFSDVAAAQPFLRMLAREAYLDHRRFDFRLYRWLPAVQAWELAQRTIEVSELPKETAAHRMELLSRMKTEQRNREDRARARVCARGCYMDA